MNKKTAHTGVVILAAGKGKRMQSELPKAMHLLHNRPMIDHIVTTIASIEIKPVVVVASDSNIIREYLGDRADYAVQSEQLGTGHAVMMAENCFSEKIKNIIVLYGDMPLVTDQALLNIIEDHETRGNVLTLATTVVPDFTDWRAQFYDFGRIMRDEKGDIIKIIEKKDASPKELNIKELNTAFFCFNAPWLWENLKKIKNKNAAGEYYLTDLVKLAFDSGARLSSVVIDPKEAIGINTKEHLEKAHSI